MKNLKFFAIVIGICIFVCVVLSAYVLLNIVPVEQRVSATPIINTALPTQTSIAVSSTSTATVTTVPIATSTMDSSSGTGACVNSAEFVSDVTIPDGSNLSSDIEFVKTWRVKNTGTCTWDSRYAIVFVDETLFSSYDAFALSVTAAPGKTVDISIPMRSPIYPGTCISAWKFRAPDRSLFGVGKNNTTLTVKLSIGGGTGTTVIAGFVYQDVNGNLQYDHVSDPLMANRTVQVQRGNCGLGGTVLASGVSGADGRYTLTGNFSGSVCVALLGEAITEFVADLTLPTGGSYNPLDLRAALPSSFISGYVWNDASGDGIRQNIEQTFAGVVVLIQKGPCGSAQSVPYSVISDANDFFQFRELYGGNYCVSIRANEGGNAAIFGNGAWTTSSSQQITVRPVTEEYANFGWQYK